jgi:hypothetical protein
MLTIQEKINSKYQLLQDEINKSKFYIMDEGFVIGVRYLIGSK